jgi:hypothetical protein
MCEYTQHILYTTHPPSATHTQWNMVYLCFWVLLCGSFCGGPSAVVKTYMPSVVVWGLIYFFFLRG